MSEKKNISAATTQNWPTRICQTAPRLESKRLQQKWFSSDETKAELYGRTRQGCFFGEESGGPTRKSRPSLQWKLGAGRSGSAVGTEDKPNAAVTGRYQRTVSVTQLTHGGRMWTFQQDDDRKHKAKSALQRLQVETREGYGGAPSQPPELTQPLWQYR